MERTHSHMKHTTMVDNSSPVQSILQEMNSKLARLERSLAELKKLIQQQELNKTLLTDLALRL